MVQESQSFFFAPNDSWISVVDENFVISKEHVEVTMHGVLSVDGINI